MSLKKYSLFSIFCYGLVFLSPLILSTLGIVHTFTGVITATTVTYILGALILTVFYFIQNEPLSIEAAMPKASLTKIILYGVVGIFVALILQAFAVVLETFLFGNSAPSKNTQDIIQTILDTPAFILATTIAGPVMEEFVFRRSLLGIVGKYTNFWIGAIVSSLFFAFAHNDGHLIIYFLLGFFFSLQYKVTGRIWTSMLTHVGMNTLVVIVQMAIQKGLISS
ncbi:CPBP family intramembrane glutamic endopeptidase [Enterococcus ratti]|uniref:Abortive infection protein n=1 Tax=Enterococcus ratti TaxID=150033 RepID=A0A1L8WNR5_9ENTE|nr:type II CAAX endopeptidase family protein [Enterococcus ratti]OJG82626.1 abortive infection protein [Enterococcus ratti]